MVSDQISIAIARLYIEMHDVWNADPLGLLLVDDGRGGGWVADFGSGEKTSHNASLTHSLTTYL
jgi:hypothetical protein